VFLGRKNRTDQKEEKKRNKGSISGEGKRKPTGFSFGNEGTTLKTYKKSFSGQGKAKTPTKEEGITWGSKPTPTPARPRKGETRELKGFPM